MQDKKTGRFVATHGEHNTPLYNLWSRIKQRCFNTRIRSYKDYGARGISMYPPWVEDYTKFANWVTNNIGPRPEPHYSLDRINNQGNYEPYNLRWATRSQQQRNKRNSRLTDANIEKLRELRKQGKTL